MQRRKFIAAAAALPLTVGAAPSFPTTDRQLIELRTYEIKFGGGGRDKLLDYLNGPLASALRQLGCPVFRLLKPLGDEEPAAVWALIAYPDAATYVAAQRLEEDPDFLAASEAYQRIGPDQPLYSRYSTQLLEAFTGMPTVVDPGSEAGLFELRTYEGYSEDAVRRKTKMFNDEEFDLFDEVGLHRVFFGKMIAGPYRPALVYMLGFRDMAERNAAWGKFGPHPKWKAMVAKPEYADSVSNIRKVFLVPV